MSRSGIIEKVIEYLRLYPNAKPSDIANYLGVNVNTIRSILSRLKRRGIVIRTEKGYSLRPGLGAGLGLEGVVQNALEYNVVKQIPVTLTRTKTSIEDATTLSMVPTMASDTDNLRSYVSNLHNKVLELERKILDIENTLNINQVRSYIDKEMLNLVVEIFEVIKMCLQAIVVNDINSLNSLVEDLEDLLNKLRRRLK